MKIIESYLQAPRLDREGPSDEALKKHDKKIWKGMVVDRSLKDKWLDDLNSIKNVVIRGTCGGHKDRLRPQLRHLFKAYIAVWCKKKHPRILHQRLSNETTPVRKTRCLDPKHDKVINKIRERAKKEGWIHDGDKLREALKKYYRDDRCVRVMCKFYRKDNPKEWEQWWNTIASRIDKAVNK